MAKPPADADPEKFIIGRGGYSNLQTAQPYHDDAVFRIDPTPVPVWWILAFNALFIAFSYGFHWLMKNVAAGDAGPWLTYAVPVALCLLTCTVFTAIVYCSFSNANRLGPWLIYDKATGAVTLPREGVSFEPREIVHLQYVTTKRLALGRIYNNDSLSELNLITCRDGQRKRWGLLRSIFSVHAFDKLLKPLMQHTKLPVMRVQDQWLGWKITERPYGRQHSRAGTTESRAADGESGSA